MLCLPSLMLCSCWTDMLLWTVVFTVVSSVDLSTEEARAAMDAAELLLEAAAIAELLEAAAEEAAAVRADSAALAASVSLRRASLRP